jgi:hypothetical protein
MDDKQENKLSMFYAVKTVNVKYVTLVNSVPALKLTQANFVIKITDIETVKEVQAIVSTGATDDKAFSMVEMVNDAVIIIGAGSAYARVKNNKALLENISYSRSELLYGRDQDAYTNCKKVYDELIPIVVELADYGITPAMMTDFKAKIDAYNTIVQSPRGVIAERKSATTQLVDLFKEGDELLKIMDGLVKGFKATEVSYYNEYFASREIIDLGVRHKKPAEPPMP